MTKDRKAGVMGNRIRDLRKNRGITQGEMAKDLGVTPYTVSNWEQGKSLPSYEMVPKLAEYFDVTTDELFDCGPGGLNQQLMHLIQRMPDARRKLVIQLFQNIDEMDQQSRELEAERS